MSSLDTEGASFAGAEGGRTEVPLRLHSGELADVTCSHVTCRMDRGHSVDTDSPVG